MVLWSTASLSLSFPCVVGGIIVIIAIGASRPLVDSRNCLLAGAMPMNGKIHMPFSEKEPPKSKYTSTLTQLEFLRKGMIDNNVKKDNGKPPKHIYEHTVQMRWDPKGGAQGKDGFKK